VAGTGQALKNRRWRDRCRRRAHRLEVWAQEVGISVGTLERWRRAGAGDASLPAGSGRPGARLECDHHGSDERSPQERWLSWRGGVYPAELDKWRASAPPPWPNPRRRVPKPAGHTSRPQAHHSPERDLLRQGPGRWPETAALLVLSKNVHRGVARPDARNTGMPTLRPVPLTVHFVPLRCKAST